MLGKNRRLDKIIEQKPELSSKYFAALDDNNEQICSLSTHIKVFPTQATTDIADKTFYDDALLALEMAKSREMSKARPGFFTQPTIKFTLPELKTGLIQCKERKANSTIYNIM
jgi:hypothetical protein